MNGPPIPNTTRWCVWGPLAFKLIVVLLAAFWAYCSYQPPVNLDQSEVRDAR